MQEDNSDLIYSLKSKKIRIESDEAVPWTLDGEYGGTYEEVLIKDIPRAVNIIRPKQKT